MFNRDRCAHATFDDAAPPDAPPAGTPAWILLRLRRRPRVAPPPSPAGSPAWLPLARRRPRIAPPPLPAGSPAWLALALRLRRAAAAPPIVFHGDAAVSVRGWPGLPPG